jgi:hypothetical protein
MVIPTSKELLSQPVEEFYDKTNNGKWSVVSNGKISVHDDKLGTYISNTYSSTSTGNSVSAATFAAKDALIKAENEFADPILDRTYFPANGIISKAVNNYIVTPL